jgi:hypothetical protein
VKSVWFAVFMATICFEGLGRKYLPQVPSAAFYFVKDLALLYGYLQYRPSRDIRLTVAYLYRGFPVVWIVAFAWTVIELFNPEHGSGLLGAIGLRAYWLWWIAPAVVASILQDERQRRHAIYTLLVFSTVIAVFAALQFAAPATSALNLYSVVDGEELYANNAMVSATGRARVSSTFSFISGFADFTILIPTLLLSIGLDAKNSRLRWAALAATCMTAAVVPMTGSRSSVILGGAILLVATWTSGLFFTRIGRRILIVGLAAAVLAVAVFPDAFIGVQSRWEDAEESKVRYLLWSTSLIPPIGLVIFDYPLFGIGTGMLQNARISMRVVSDWAVEVEAARYLVELGPAGFLLVWTAKLGLMIGLLRAYAILKRAGRRGGATGALCYAVLTPNGNLTFDHIWQALYFMGCGFILAEVVSVLRQAAAQPVPQEVIADKPAAVAVSA